MNLEQECSAMQPYLAATAGVDCEDERICHLTERLFQNTMSQLQVIATAFAFVRDEISHSADSGGRVVTKRASEVLRYRDAMCYGKTLLLAALLRHKEIPTGFCYQRLRGDDGRHMIHAVNAVYLADEGIWVRMDPRGGEKGGHLDFDTENPEQELLVYHVDAQAGEMDYPMVYAEHPASVMVALHASEDAQVGNGAVFTRTTIG